MSTMIIERKMTMNKISAKKLAKLMNDGEKLNVIDVREDAEVAMGKILGATHIPLGQIPERVEELDKAKEYYLVCMSGGRSGNACQFLASQGYNVTNVTGGMMSWNGELE